MFQKKKKNLMKPTDVGCALEKQLGTSAPSGMSGCSTAAAKTATSNSFLKDIFCLNLFLWFVQLKPTKIIKSFTDNEIIARPPSSGEPNSCLKRELIDITDDVVRSIWKKIINDPFIAHMAALSWAIASPYKLTTYITLKTVRRSH